MSTNNTHNDLVNLISGQTLKENKSDNLASDIAKILLANNYIYDLDNIIRDVIEQRINDGIVEAKISSAFTLNSSTRNEIKSLIRRHYPASKQIVLYEIVDANIVGGVLITLPKQELDLSIRSKLDKIKSLSINGSLRN